MFIEVIKHTPNLGLKGERLKVPDNEARVHIVLGNAKKVDAPKPKRRYRRRDMRVEKKIEVKVEPVEKKAEEDPIPVEIAPADEGTEETDQT